MKRSTIIPTGPADSAATVDSIRQFGDKAFGRAEQTVGAGDESDQSALSERLDLLCTRLGARNAAVDAEFDGTVGDGL